ncbi:hypothetical protein [Streptomyces viridosporus]|uniref:hypothetical protein n=1 Tax=Streptomyces viridosporus TaxID=67581 RepID=UPI0036F59ABB
MAGEGAGVGSDGRQRLLAARNAYTRTASPHHDEVPPHVAHRARREGGLGTADIGALPPWKRLRAGTRWAGALMAVAEAEVRPATAAAVAAVRDTSLSRSAAARAGRAAPAGLPGLVSGDAPAPAVLTAAAPDRRAACDRRAHAGLRSLGIPLAHSRGRYGRHIDAIDRLLAAAPDPVRTWTPRETDTALSCLPSLSPAPPSA